MSDQFPEQPPAETSLPDAERAAIASPRGWLVAFRAMRHRNFRLFFGGQLISLIGTWMQTVAQSWLVLKLSNSAMMLGLVSFASFVPILLVALFAGVIIDHVDRRRLIIVTQVLLMLSALALAILTWTGAVRVEHVIILAAFNGFVSAFDMPARQAFVVEMVGKEDLPNAIALNSMIFNGARAIGPAVAGLLIAITGTAMCFFLNGISYLAAIWSLFAMHLAIGKSAPSFGGKMLKSLKEGLVYVWEHQPTRILLAVVAINSGFGITYSVLIPVFARDILKVGAHGYGFLMAAQGIGAVLGAVYLASRPERGPALRHTLTAGLFCTAIATIAFGLSRNMALSLLAQLIVGAGIINYMAGTNTMLQLFVSDRLRGRVMSIYTLSFIGLAPLGALEVGFVGEHVSPEVAVIVCGVISLGCGLLLLTGLPAIAAAQAALSVALPAAD
ncbi:MAG TPA: MFS transporter [Candidatus Binataceae bacterium]|nr:MFS transporter [Candidatus Binataceae bacterium]